MKQPLSYIHPNAKIDESVVIDPFVTIDNNVTIGAGTHIYSNVTIMSGTTIGKNCKIYPGAVIGGTPQDLKYKGEETEVIIGDNNTIRESVTINKGTSSRNKTIIGNNCLLMAYAHVAHDCILGNNIILANATQLAGEVEVDDFAILGGGTLVHQFSRIGSHAMIQGGTKVTKAVPPYITAGRDPLSYAGVNSIGLRRRGYTIDQIRDIQQVYRYIYQKQLNVSQAIELIQTELPATKERDDILLFIKKSPRGIIKGYFDRK